MTRSAAPMQIAPLVILALAFLLQVTGLAVRTFHGDELTSIREAQEIGLNPNGLLYFVPMHWWVQGGTNEFWLRMPSVLIGVAAIAVGYALGRALVPRLALVFMLLFATAPFLLEYTQQVRFYSFFLFASLFAYWTLVRYLKRPSSRRLGMALLANVLVLGAHFFGALVIVSELLAALFLTPRLKQRTKAGILVGMAGAAAVLLLVEPVRRAGYYLVSVLTNPYGDPTYTVSRGLAIANAAKLALTLYFFSFGERLYPLDTKIVIPGILLLGVALVLGSYYWWKQRGIGGALLLAVALMPLLVYLVFDPLAPPSLQGAAPRYLIFVLPFFYLVLAAGTMFRWSRWLLVPLVLMNLAGVLSFWQGDWSYGDDLVNWRQVRDFVAARHSPGTLLVIDGRAEGPTTEYFPGEWERVGLFGYEPDGRAARVITVTADFHPAPRQNADRVTRDLEQNYTMTEVLAQYPLFVSVFDRSAKPPGTAEVNANGRIDLPYEQYGLEFQDLRLPVTSTIGTSTMPLFGAVGLDNSAEKHVLAVSLAEPVAARMLWVVSQVVGAANTGAGEPAAKLRVHFADGTTREFEIKPGQETGTWDGTCGAPGCETAFTWHKRLALLGASAYPGSWQDFTARGFAYPFTWEGEQAVTGIELEKMGEGGTFYVWGLVLR